MTSNPWLPTALPWIPPAYDDEVVYAIRCFERGIANAAQQHMVWRYLMYVSRASEDFADLSFRPDDKGGERATVFAEGMRFVGLMFRKLLRPECTPKPVSTEPPPTIQKRMRQRRTLKRAA